MAKYRVQVTFEREADSEQHAVVVISHFLRGKGVHLGDHYQQIESK